MARPRPLLYQVRQVKTPYHGKSWKVTAYIGGKRKQHWFASEREAKTFAGDSNAELHAYGSQLSDLSPSDRVRAFWVLGFGCGSDIDGSKHAKRPSLDCLIQIILSFSSLLLVPFS